MKIKRIIQQRSQLKRILRMKKPKIKPQRKLGPASIKMSE